MSLVRPGQPERILRIVVNNEFEGDKRVVKVTIPPGVHEGQAVRVANEGEPGHNGGPHGDLVEAHVGRDLLEQLTSTFGGQRWHPSSPGWPICVGRAFSCRNRSRP